MGNRHERARQARTAFTDTRRRRWRDWRPTGRHIRAASVIVLALLFAALLWEIAKLAGPF